MKLVHTGDWHVGRTIRGRSRAEEHAEVLAELVALADTERADLVLVAGDQFDTSAPSPESERLVYRTLLDLAATGAAVVVVAGNHDHPRRWQAVAPLLAAGGVHVAYEVARPDAGGVLELTAGGGGVRIALVPFLSKRHAVRASALMGLAEDQQELAYAAKVAGVLEALCEGFAPDAVNLVLAHLMVAGASPSGGERPGHTVFEYAVPATAFPSSAHLVALGHLHRPQRVPAPAPVWYAGSPLQLDFGEGQDQKATLVVEAAPGVPASVRQVPVTGGRRLRTVRGTLAELESLAGTTGGDHVRAIVEGPARAGLAEQVRGWFPEVVDVILARSDRLGGAEAPGPTRLGRPAGELFAEYLAERDAHDERVLALFDELHAEETEPG